ncbi:MAG: hypothetical protein A2Y18_03610 [Clostridiales bacterium GWD2_32_19]|nr:MAG: hypothetical protein A2Y18_03610 [Clostridiales bacterium GWD2_32_19]
MKNSDYRTVVEIEEKFFCDNDIETIKDEIEREGFKFIKRINEKDEYFTDLAGEYIKNRTCLRTRTIDDKELEITYKGKSEVFSSFYAKKESNIISEVKSYENIVDLFKVFGYHSYVVVDKIRDYYSKTENEITYNILIDSILNIGEFLEFEIIIHDDSSEGEKYFLEFIDKFKSLKLNKADLPYRDFVAEYYYNKLQLNKIKNIHIESSVDNILEDCNLICKVKEKGIFLSSNIVNEELFVEKKEECQVIYKHQDYIEVNSIKLKNITQLLAILLYK